MLKKFLQISLVSLNLILYLSGDFALANVVVKRFNGPESQNYIGGTFTKQCTSYSRFKDLKFQWKCNGELSLPSFDGLSWTLKFTYVSGWILPKQPGFPPPPPFNPKKIWVEVADEDRLVQAVPNSNQPIVLITKPKVDLGNKGWSVQSGSAICSTQLPTQVYPPLNTTAKVIDRQFVVTTVTTTTKR